jgi:RNA 2',3'-cyclic 3'-phosphodiesterase
MSEGANLRLFFALWPDAATRADIAALAARAVPQGGGRAVAAANYHVTLAFIGATPASQLDAVRAIGRRVQTPAATLNFDALDYWPKPEVLVVAARNAGGPFESLWQHLHAELAAAGFALKPKAWRPHITIARKVLVAPPRVEFAPIAWRASEFALLESKTDGVESRYTVLECWPLLYAASE